MSARNYAAQFRRWTARQKRNRICAMARAGKTPREIATATKTRTHNVIDILNRCLSHYNLREDRGWI